MNVFICSPYQGDVERNTEKARQYLRYTIDKGHTPFAPHLLYPQVLEEETEREKGMMLGFEMLKIMDELWVFGREITIGMWQEIKTAEEQGIPVRYIKQEVKEI